MTVNQDFANAVMSLVDQHGGVAGLLQKFQEGGLGGVASSWVKDGTPNQSVSPADLHSALGTETLQSAAQQNGMSTNDFVAQLANHLPDLIDHLTPGGQGPQSTGSALLNLAMGYFRGRPGYTNGPDGTVDAPVWRRRACPSEESASTSLLQPAS